MQWNQAWIWMSVMLLGLSWSSPAAAGDSLELWTAAATQKIFRDDRPATGTDTTSPSLTLAAARGEWEAGQIVLRPQERTDLTSATVSALAGPGGATLGAQNVQLLRVAYVYLPRDNRAWPDALPPLKTPLHIEAGQAQPLWVSVHIPAGTAPGEYRGAVTLNFSAGPLRQIPLTLTVWPLEIPVKPSMRTAFGIYYDLIIRQHGLTPEDPRAGAVKDAYFECLLQHRISPYTVPCEDVTTTAAARYIEDPRLTSFVIPYVEDEAKLRATVGALRERGWLDKGYFYAVDEPVEEAQYQKLREAANRIHGIDPKLKIVAPFFGDPKGGAPGRTAYDALEGIVNIWCPTSYYFQAAPMKAKGEAGGELWWYVCCGPQHPYANLMIDWDGTSHELLFWQQKQNHVNGLLYWGATYWGETRDPWNNAATYTGNGNWDSYGDGSLLYPGDRVGLDGPVSSIRLELARDGMEDYELLTQYGQKLGEDKLQTLIGQVSRSLTDFDKTPATVQAARRECAEGLIAAQAK